MKLFVLAARASAAAALTARVCAKPSSSVTLELMSSTIPPLFLTICPHRRGPCALITSEVNPVGIKTPRTIPEKAVLMLSTSSRLAIPFSVPNVRVSGNEYQVEVTNGKDNKTKSKELTR
ncbi:hypothetical protein DFH08DRAFT_967691 [Mycena albidolilacea]|uniref:Uncharacterized protein n=1 Tax=Mycena albidolilacea TaxID=1033008 RepID=A0AAD6ZLT4_9AGAR|nr:hypothetical protein DFH08DRAFT_967691 [Mycena albidolilacea]